MRTKTDGGPGAGLRVHQSATVPRVEARADFVPLSASYRTGESRTPACAQVPACSINCRSMTLSMSGFDWILFAFSSSSAYRSIDGLSSLSGGKPGFPGVRTARFLNAPTATRRAFTTTRLTDARGAVRRAGGGLITPTNVRRPPRRCGIASTIWTQSRHLLTRGTFSSKNGGNP